MWTRVTFGVAVSTMVVCSIVLFPRDGGARNTVVFHDIHPSGEARFFARYGAESRALWTVSCRIPMRSCVARAPGLVLSITGDGQVGLVGFAPPQARISVLDFSMTHPLPGLFDHPLGNDELAALTKPDAVLVIEQKGVVVMRTQLAGIAEVISYLQWLSTAANAGERDARNWTGQAPQSTRPLTALQARVPLDADRRLQPVPRTKPQVEFAIRAQSGASFFDSKGR